jgi:hypothetical protein
MFLELILLAKSVATPAPAAPPSAPPDACAALIPPGLAAQLQAEQSGFELPKAADAGETRLQAISASGAWPCPFVALGDFDGDGNLDRALLLRNPSSGTVKLIAALNMSGAWQIKLAEDWGVPLADSYLQPLEPGLYQRSDASTKPAAELDLLNSIQSDSAGFAVGKLAGAYAVFFFQNAAWQRVWLKD